MRNTVLGEYCEMSSLSIIIPAYNEEEAIGSTLRRCIEERSRLSNETELSEVEIIVVDDGSTDRTSEIVAQFEEVRLIKFEHNRGYGAALKAGFANAKGDLVGFLDADGTCDPKYFADLCNTLKRENADVVLGSRMGPSSKMPKVRRLGNRIYAFIVSLISSTFVSDTASGMRVLRKESLKKLYPLPDGLHFTPAMTCKAVLDNELSICEIPMTYAEREGRSKLSVIKDGFRFLQVILNISLTYKPSRLFGLAGLFLFIIGFAYLLFPVEYYLQNRKLEEWMIYRLISVMIFLAGGLNLVVTGESAESLLLVTGCRTYRRTFLGELLSWFFSGRRLLVFGMFTMLLGLALNYRTIYEYLTTSHITVHWSYVLVGGTLVLTGLQLSTLGILRVFVQSLFTHRMTQNDHEEIDILTKY
jgi:glycosyltransferase involved in cell wall biosynthesis